MLGWAKKFFETQDFGSDDSIVVLTARANPALLENWIARAVPMNHGFLWAPGDLAKTRDAWTVTGHGAACELTAHDERRWDDVRGQATREFGRVVERAEPGVVAPRLRVFGGASFIAAAVGQDVAAAWPGFSEASFTLPRWLFGVRDGDAFLRFAFSRSELSSPDKLLAEIESAETAAPSKISESRSASKPISAHVDDPAFWRALVENALAVIRRGELQKVVLARRSSVPTSASLSKSLQRLREQNAESTTFAFTRGAATFLGASPERLIFLDQNRFVTEALAGTIARSTDDEAAKRALLSSDKDRREHQIVVDGIRDALTPLARTIDEIALAPEARTLGRMHHLATPITGIVDSDTHVLALVAALHPTPAVSGLPKALATDFIGNNEGAERGWYASPVGWFDDRGSGTFAVAIRSALVENGHALVFAGAGIVDGSEPDAEYRETQLKQKTILAALGALP